MSFLGSPPSSPPHGQHEGYTSPWKPPPLANSEFLRVVVLLDGDHGRCVVWDSDRVFGSSPTSASRRVKDEELIGELLFGSIPLSYAGQTTKVHELPAPRRLLLSSIFRISEEAIALHTAAPSLSASMPGSSFSFAPSTSAAIPMPSASRSAAPSAPQSLASSFASFAGVPPRQHTHGVGGGGSSSTNATRSLSSSPTHGPPVFDASASVYEGEAFDGVPRAGSRSGPSSQHGSSSTMSLSGSHRQRRLSRSMVFDLQRGLTSAPSAPSSRRGALPLVALAAIFSVDESSPLFSEFLVTHFPVLQQKLFMFQDTLTASMCTIVAASRARTHTSAPHTSSAFHLARLAAALPQSQSLKDAFDRMRQSLFMLYHVPRLREPVWLNLMTFAEQRSLLRARFVAELYNLTCQLDGLRTNHFLAAAITAVLAHHGGWVATATPASPNALWHDGEGLVQSRIHHYDPLWAQLSDLYGAITDPSHTARTVVVGRSMFLVNRLLYVLSYFIRCSEVYELLVLPGEFRDSMLNPPKSQEEITVIHRPAASAPMPVPSHHARAPDAIVEESAADLQSLGKASRGQPHTPTTAATVPAPLSFASGSSSSALPPPPPPPPSDPSSSTITAASRQEQDTRLAAQPRSPSSHSDRGRSTTPAPSSPPHAAIVHSTPHASPTAGPDASLGSPIARRLRTESQSRDSLSGSVDLWVSGPSHALLQSLAGMDTSLSCPASPTPAAVPPGAGTPRPGLTPAHMLSASPSGSVASDGQARLLLCMGSPQPSVQSYDPFSEFRTVEPLPSDCRGITPDLSYRGDATTPPVVAFHKCFGRSLLAGYSDSYVSGVVLHGLPNSNFLNRLDDDLQADINHPLFVPTRVERAVGIVMNTGISQCIIREHTASEDPKSYVVAAAPHVVAMLAAFRGLFELGVSSAFCVELLEDRLQLLYHQSQVVAQYMLDSPREVSGLEMSRKLGFCEADLRLFASVARMHTPSLATRHVQWS